MNENARVFLLEKNRRLGKVFQILLEIADKRTASTNTLAGDIEAVTENEGGITPDVSINFTPYSGQRIGDVGS